MEGPSVLACAARSPGCRPTPAPRPLDRYTTVTRPLHLCGAPFDRRHPARVRSAIPALPGVAAEGLKARVKKQNEFPLSSELFYKQAARRYGRYEPLRAVTSRSCCTLKSYGLLHIGGYVGCYIGSWSCLLHWLSRCWLHWPSRWPLYRLLR